MAIVTNFISLIESEVSSDKISSVSTLPFKAKGLIVEVNGTGSFSVTIESSPDGVSFYSIGELDKFQADSMQSLSDQVNIFRFVRAKIDIGTGGGTVNICKIHFTK